MSDYRTENCHLFGHPEIVLPFTGAPPDPLWLLQTLEEMVASGSVFKHGQAVEICGGTCKIHGRENGDMELRQPDMTIIPIQWIPGMDQPVRMAVLQMHVCRLLGSPLEYVRLDQAVQISAAALAGATSFTMSRETPNGRVAGWTITAAEAAARRVKSPGASWSIVG